MYAKMTERIDWKFELNGMRAPKGEAKHEIEPSLQTQLDLQLIKYRSRQRWKK
jgi:hypothetical protein